MKETLTNENKEVKMLYYVGFISSTALAAAAAVTFAIAICTPPISGPFSAGGGITYPYTDIISRFPRDYYWMYPAMLLMLNYVIYMVCIDRYAGMQQKVFSRTALLFACLSAGILFVNYFVQVSVIQPSLINGETDAIAILTQYNPHGIFIALEEVGYIVMSVSILFLVPVFTGTGRIQAGIRWIAILGFILTAVSLIVISAIYGVGREDRFEIAVITIDFMALILLGILSGILFRQEKA